MYIKSVLRSENCGYLSVTALIQNVTLFSSEYKFQNPSGYRTFDSEYQHLTFLPKIQKTKKSLKISDLSVFMGQRSELSNFLKEDMELLTGKDFQQWFVNVVI
ncbi:MAG: hypothetical protein ACJA0Q_002064 [Saprospiraceae bacterium]